MSLRLKRKHYHGMCLDPVFWDRAKDPQAGEKAMWYSAIEEAIHCLNMKPTACYERKEKIKERARARNWFRNNGMEPGSFRWVCIHLGLDAETIKREVMK